MEDSVRVVFSRSDRSRRAPKQRGPQSKATSVERIMAWVGEGRLRVRGILRLRWCLLRWSEFQIGRRIGGFFRACLAGPHRWEAAYHVAWKKYPCPNRGLPD